MDNPGYLDTVEVIGSIPVAPIKKVSKLGGSKKARLFLCPQNRIRLKSTRTLLSFVTVNDKGEET